MKTFKDFGIKTDLQSFTGEKIKISKILNKDIVVLDYKIEDSKYGNGNNKCLFMQIEVDGIKRVLFTGSTVLIDTIQKVPKGDGFPFKTTIVQENERYEFS